MKVAIVYDTVYGTNEHIANRFYAEIEQRTGWERLTPESYDEDIDIRVFHVDEFDVTALHIAQAVIITGPTHNWMPTPKLLKLAEMFNLFPHKLVYLWNISTSLRSPQTTAAAIMYKHLLPYAKFNYIDNYHVIGKEGPLTKVSESELDDLIETVKETVKRR